MLIMKNVSKTFNPGTVNEKCALKNLNLELKDGDFATIIGSNGAGKSTLFNAILPSIYSFTVQVSDSTFNIPNKSP